MKAYFFKDKRTGAVRRTPIFANSAAEAKKKLRRPSPKNAVVAKSRPITVAERKAAKNGKWVNSRVSSDFGDRRGYGPKPKSRRKS